VVAVFAPGIEKQLYYPHHPAVSGHLYVSDVSAAAFEMSLAKCDTNGGFKSHERYALTDHLYEIDPLSIACS
jgi:hypothetical protein